MKTSIEMVKEFHIKFNHPIKIRPELKDFVLMKLRHSLIEEELKELEEALLNQETVNVLDALCDLQYVLDGAFLAFGMHEVKDKAMEEVHKSNMSKLGVDGKPIVREDGKILKGPNYFPPNLEQFFHNI